MGHHRSPSGHHHRHRLVNTHTHADTRRHTHTRVRTYLRVDEMFAAELHRHGGSQTQLHGVAPPAVHDRRRHRLVISVPLNTHHT
jgi:hypothetical protein